MVARQKEEKAIYRPTADSTKQQHYDVIRHDVHYIYKQNMYFPLWYNHEVEGKRTDTRVCNLEYLQTDWYIDQMKRPAYDSPALPISWRHEDYQEGRREIIAVRPEWRTEIKALMAANTEEAKNLLGEEPFELKNIINKWVLNEREEMQCIPTDSITVTSDAGQMVISLKDKNHYIRTT